MKLKIILPTKNNIKKVEELTKNKANPPYFIFFEINIVSILHKLFYIPVYIL